MRTDHLNFWRNSTVLILPRKMFKYLELFVCLLFIYLYFISFQWQIMFLTLPTRLSAEPTTSVKLGRRSAGLPGRECDSRSVVRLPLDSPGLLPVTTTKCIMYSKIEGLVIFEHYSVHLHLWMKFYLNSSKIQVHYWSVKKSLLSLWPKGKQCWWEILPFKL